LLVVDPALCPIDSRLCAGKPWVSQYDLVVSKVSEEVAQVRVLGSCSGDDVGVVFQGSCLVWGSVDIEESSFLGESSYQ